MLAKGARGNPKGRGAKIVRDIENPAQPTLVEQSIDKNLADSARKLAAMSDRCHSGREKRPSVTPA